MCGCNQKRPPAQLPKSLLTSSGSGFTQQEVDKAIDTNDKTVMVTVEYTGESEQTFSIRSRVSRDVIYRFGNNDAYRTRAVFLGDANWLMGLTDRQGKPAYRVVSNIARLDPNDPSVFIGQKVMA